MSTTTMRIGDVTVTTLADVTVDYPWPLDQLFPNTPADGWQPYRERYPEMFGGQMIFRTDYTCLLIRDSGRNLLVDTGMGRDNAFAREVMASGRASQTGQLLKKLAAAGVAPEDIDTVLLTHLHPDHVGWNLQQHEGGFQPTFPKARYLTHRADWLAFQRPEVQAHYPAGCVQETVLPLDDLGVLDLIELDTGDCQLSETVAVFHTPGHTPGHMSVRVAAGGAMAPLVGDVLAHPAQVSEPEWNARTEADGLRAIQTRKALLDQIEAKNCLVAAFHFREPGFGRVVRQNGQRVWQPLAAEEMVYA